MYYIKFPGGDVLASNNGKKKYAVISTFANPRKREFYRVSPIGLNTGFPARAFYNIEEANSYAFEIAKGMQRRKK